MTSRKEAVLKPRICCLGAAEEVAICAEPVPVRRPGVRGAVLELVDWAGDAQTGRTKRGLYLECVCIIIMAHGSQNKINHLLDGEPKNFNPRCPVGNNDISRSRHPFFGSRYICPPLVFIVQSTWLKLSKQKVLTWLSLQ